MGILLDIRPHLFTTCLMVIPLSEMEGRLSGLLEFQNSFYYVFLVRKRILSMVPFFNIIMNLVVYNI